MSHSTHDKQRVFLAYRALFKGDNAQLRKEKNIKKLVEKHKHGSEAFIKSLGGVGKIVAILKPLLREGVFGSEAKAKQTFPSLFKTSAKQDERHSTAEASTARMEAEALVNVEKMDQSDQCNPNSQGQQTNGVDDVLDVPIEESAPEPEKAMVSSDGEIVIRSLYPSYVPFRTQHLVLTSAQRLLEECCFDFTAKWAPSLIDQYHWDCPEAIELNKWTLVILKRFSKLPDEALNYTPGKGIREVLTSVNVLRHSAVHRLHTSAKGIDQMIQSAAIFANALRDADRVSQLEKLHTEMESKIRAQELNKNFLEEKLAAELDEIREIRKALDKREQEAIDALYREDNENKSLVGSMLEDSVRGIFGLVGHQNSRAGKHDESPDEAEIGDFQGNGLHSGINKNIVEEPPEPEEAFSPLPEEPMQEECLPEIEELVSIEEPVAEETPAAVEMWPEDQIAEDLMPPDEAPVAEYTLPTEEPLAPQEEVPPSVEPEPDPVLLPEAAEQPIEVPPSVEPEPDPVLSPEAAEQPIEDSPIIAAAEGPAVMEPAVEPDTLEDEGQWFHRSLECNHDAEGKQGEDPEPEQSANRDIEAVKTDIKNSLGKLIDPIIRASDLSSRKEKLSRKSRVEKTSKVREQILETISESLANDKFELYDLISKRLDILSASPRSESG